MNRIANFETVSQNQLNEVWEKRGLPMPVPDISEIILPVRATSGSAGYDFRSPFSFSLRPGEKILIPTGLRVRIADGWVLAIFPRSGLGCKFRFQLDNSVGIIDSDYYGAANEGHIMLCMTNDSRENKTLVINKGDAVAQGLFLPFGITEDDAASGVRTGGFGSTTKEK